ncbi:helix-turn-helix domain-containing protein [Aestuariispira ectoiniformans]|uniref:helix-turn-helix domain-containing protein n=1 Tax=Aestuariispira ectoiniformans TaxID=2775080 RepID=UPI00223A9E9F|nr:helix-turn-helix transcriptional regulator [Aestuariispira ectoiniformans]
MSGEFAANLSLLCSYHPSIAEVCRKLSFNRQQFNKYLSGRSRPSRSNMRRICDFFGVTEAEILLEPAQFENMIAVKRRPVAESALSKPMRHLETLYQTSQSLERYVGYYYRYFYSFGNAGKIIKSLATIYEENGKYFWKNIELIRTSSSGKTTALNKYDGAVFFLADRIYIVEYETLQKNSLTQVTLYPCYRSRVDVLAGIQTGGPVRRGRRPGASKVVLEYLGRDVDVRKALRGSGLFEADSPGLSPSILEMINNIIPEGSYVLDVDEP